jgi:hypothetical protein
MSMLLLPLFLVAQDAPTASPPETDWASILQADAQFMHDDIAANHPGPVNALDPDFGKRNDEGLALVLDRARRVTNFAGYYYALKAYAASFDDGHLGFRTTDKAPAFTPRWPGFLTGFDRDRQVVKARADGSPVPLGAVLQSCDGKEAAALATSNVGAFEGRWFLASRRRIRGAQLFIDQGNPFIARPARCRFVVDNIIREVTLDWRPIADEALTAKVRDTNQIIFDPIAARTLADGTRWFTLSGFDADPDSDDARALGPLIAAMRADRAAIIDAPRIIFDLRGNGGGSSDWSAQIAEILWGRQRVDALPRSGGVDWRASADNVKTLAAFRDQVRDAPGTSDEMKGWIDATVDGVTAAYRRGEPLWRHTDPAAPTRTSGEPPAPPAGPVYFITDGICASACLDAAGLWQELGAVQVGQETSADTLYMDVRNDGLPSGLTSIAVPMKVYRGRSRGSNEPMRPTHVYNGDMRDTAALEKWIGKLPGG